MGILSILSLLWIQEISNRTHEKTGLRKNLKTWQLPKKRGSVGFGPFQSFDGLKNMWEVNNIEYNEYLHFFGG